MLLLFLAKLNILKILFSVFPLGQNKLIKSKLTFGPHTDGQALFQPAFLALASHVHVDLAVVAVLTLVNGIFGDASPEEPLAPFARECIVMVTGRPITAHQTQLFGRPVTEDTASGRARAAGWATNRARGVDVTAGGHRGGMGNFLLFNAV